MTPDATARAGRESRSQARSTRLTALDGLRGIAAVIIVLHHTLPQLPGAWLGVDVFFVLSGFLITTLLVRELDRTASIDFKSFYMRRVRRLLPALLLLLLGAAFWTLALASPQEASATWQSILSGLGFVNNWVQAGRPRAPHDPASQLWSLSIEEQFYILWPLLLFVVYRWRGAGASLTAALAGVILVNINRIALFVSGASWIRIYYGSDSRADALLIGCATALAFRMGLVRRVPTWTAAAAAAILAGLTLVSTTLAPVLLVAGLSAAIVVAWLSRSDWKPMASAPARWLGERSYSLYLWHPVVLFTLEDRGWRVGWKLAGVGLGVSLLLASASYRYVERPFLRRGHSGVVDRHPILTPDEHPQMVKTEASA